MQNLASFSGRAERKSSYVAVLSPLLSKIIDLFPSNLKIRYLWAYLK